MATNALYALFAVSQPSVVEARLKEWKAGFRLLSTKVTDSSWFIIVPSTVTTKELSDQLGLTPNGDSGSGIIIRSESYYGRTNRDTWEWVTSKIGENLDSPIQ